MLPKVIRDLILDYKANIELKERMELLMCELRYKTFFKHVVEMYHLFFHVTG